MFELYSLSGSSKNSNFDINHMKGNESTVILSQVKFVVTFLNQSRQIRKSLDFCLENFTIKISKP